MRSIADDKGSFTTHGNSNGVYDQMEREAINASSKSTAAKERFNRKPWYLE